jgi:hypothetical protein
LYKRAKGVDVHHDPSNSGPRLRVALEQLGMHLAQLRHIPQHLACVQERLTKEINYWDWRAQELRNKEKAGHPSPRINSQRAQQRADELSERLNRRKEELELERQTSAVPPVIIGRALVVPIGLLLGK